jgi:hypothetical protein
MSAGPVATNIVLVPYPVPCAGVDYGRERKPPKYPQKPRPETWRPQRAIPRHQVDRRLIEDMRERAKRAIEVARPIIEAALRSG